MKITEQDLELVMLCDRHRLWRMLRAAREQRRRPGDRQDQQEQMLALFQASKQRRELRLSQRPTINLPPELPISQRRDEIAEAIRRHQVVVICGETGSGKSTQLPKICLQLGRGAAGMIGHTQPRRLAARTIANRVSQELGGGHHVGFKVRFSDTVQPTTLVKLMTDGILLAETQSDRFLEQYDTLILDEAHERSLNIDFLLGYLHRLRERRPDLKIIITSATIDVQRFSEHFAWGGQPAPVLEVSGRVYPVELRYRPPPPADDAGEANLQEGVFDAAVELIREGPGDILVFLPTEREIRETAKHLRAQQQQLNWGKPVEIMPLYARLSAAEQQRVFEPHGGRRIVLATNVAESSLTVPGIRYVIDSGIARLSRYAARSKVQRLPIEPISQASAEQRKGRCGRLGPGICIRLYAEDDFQSRDRFTTPEIRRTNLAAVILQTHSLQLGDINAFPLLDPPHREAVQDGYKTLHEIGALDERRELTDIGRKLSRLPVDPRIGRIILAGQDEACLPEMLILAAALEIQDPRERPLDKSKAADEAHQQFAHPDSDFLGLLKMWDFLHDLKAKLSGGQFRKACRQNFLSYNRVAEWMELVRQLRQVAEECGLRPRRAELKYDALHRALLTGFLANVAFRGAEYEYTGGGGGKFQLWPGSYAFASRPRWVMAAELVETSRRYLRTVARIEPEWLEALAQHLVKRSHGDPHWSRKSGSVMALERVTLFGLAIVIGRRVFYGPIDRPNSRQLFIEHALLQEDMQFAPAFLQRNRELRQQVESLAAKARRRDLLVEEQAMRDFYDARLPADISSVHELKEWMQSAEGRQGESLCMCWQDLLPAQEAEHEAEAFPDQLRVADMQLELQYSYQPGERDDGVTITVPKDGLRQLDNGRLGWLVPGLVEEKIVALIRSLPKSLRRNFVPAPEVAKRIAQSLSLSFGEGDFLAAVADALTRHCDDKIQPGDFRQDSLPPHLTMNVNVIDQRGKRLMAGRDLQVIRDKLGLPPQTAAAAAIEHVAWSRDGLTTWDWGVLPEQVPVRRGGVDIPAFPTIIDQGAAVGLRLLDSRAASAAQTRGGLRRLVVLSEHKELKRNVQWLPRLSELLVKAGGLPDRDCWREQLQVLLADRAFFPEGPGQPALAAPRTLDEFERRLVESRRRLPAAADEVARWLGPLFEQYHLARLAGEQAARGKDQQVAADVRQQLNALLPAGFLASTPWCWLAHFPRYLQAIAARLEKLQHGGQARDQRARQELMPHLQRLGDPTQESPLSLNPHWVQYRWMVEEFRVSQFAQELGASLKVSSKRLDEQWLLAQKK